MERPKMIEVEGVLVPTAPTDARDLGVDPSLIGDLALCAAFLVPQFNTEWLAQRLHLPRSVTGEVLDQLREEMMLDVLGHAAPFGYRYAISSRGRERARRLFEITDYVGPAPVSLATYTNMVVRQTAQFSEVTPEGVATCLEGLILEPEGLALAGLAASSGRSLFIFGPAGNGKTSVARLLHEAREGDLWIPHCIEVEGQFIRVFDPQCHRKVELDVELSRKVDRRWARIRRPLIVVGGEMTLESCDLTYSPSERFYEAPLQMKANGGTFVIDDFGRQRVAPGDLLNRWIIPLEHQFDHLTLRTGQAFHVPFLLMLIVATNLDVDDVTDPAFLRRMGYRMFLDKPSPERYVEIFQRYIAQCGVAAPDSLVKGLLERYEVEQREFRGCEPRPDRACSRYLPFPTHLLRAQRRDP